MLWSLRSSRRRQIIGLCHAEPPWIGKTQTTCAPRIGVHCIPPIVAGPAPRQGSARIFRLSMAQARAFAFATNEDGRGVRQIRHGMEELGANAETQITVLSDGDAGLRTCKGR
jgi:hypothetical protein